MQIQVLHELSCVPTCEGLVQNAVTRYGRFLEQENPNIDPKIV